MLKDIQIRNHFPKKTENEGPRVGDIKQLHENTQRFENVFIVEHVLCIVDE